jgi:diguanylate cyclase (GGDEF)-like protein
MRASCGNREADAYRRFTEVVGPVLAQASVDAVRREAADALARFLPYDAFDLRAADDESRELVPVLARGPRASVVMRTGRIGYGRGLSGWVASRQEALLANNALRDPRAMTVLGTPRTPEAVIGVPLLANGRLKHVLLVRRFGDMASFSEEELALTRCFTDLVAIALDNANTRAQLQRQATTDLLTGLSNNQALQCELESHEETWPFSVLVLDFDGLRAANAAFGHREGGDVLIAAVGAALGRLAAPTEFAARMYTAGDEFALLLPGQDEAAAMRRRLEVEAALDALEVPERLAAVYRGASVGAATRQPTETAGQTLGRSITAMRARKSERRPRRP